MSVRKLFFILVILLISGIWWVDSALAQSPTKTWKTIDELSAEERKTIDLRDNTPRDAEIPSFDDLQGRDPWEFSWKVIGTDILYNTIRFPNARSTMTITRQDGSALIRHQLTQPSCRNPRALLLRLTADCCKKEG